MWDTPQSHRRISSEQDCVTAPLNLANGHFRPRIDIFTQALKPTSIFLQLVEAEFTAQIEHFLQSGLTAYHLTTHLHFHLMPSLRTIVFQLAQIFGIRWIRSHQLTSTILPFSTLPYLKCSNPKSSLQPDYLMPIIFWLRVDPKSFYKRLAALQGSAEIVVHPSTLGDESFPKGLHICPINVLEKCNT